MSSLLTWNEIKTVLVKQLKTSEHILTWGTIGSLNLNTDIDTIITKKPTSPSTLFFQEVHNIFTKLDQYLWKKYRTRVLRFGQATTQYLIDAYVSSKKIQFHTMLYISYPQIDKDWQWGLFEHERVKDILKDKYVCIFGNTYDLFTPTFMKKNPYEHVFTYLYQFDILNTPLPDKLITKNLNGCFKLLYKNKLHLNPPLAKNAKEARLFFYQLCTLLDTLSKKSIKKKGTHDLLTV